jgi:hypothetical protein
MQLLAVIEGVDCLPPVLSTEPPKRSNTRETLTEFVVANLGDSSSLLPYLIVSIFYVRSWLSLVSNKNIPDPNGK